MHRHPQARAGQARKISLSEEEKQQIAEMSGPKDMDPSERKRQYSALRRAIRASASPALTNKFELCSDTERPGHDKLQLFVLNPSQVW